MGKRRGVYRGFEGNLREKDHLGGSGVDGNIVFKWIFKNWDVVLCTGSNWLRIGTGGGHL